MPRTRSNLSPAPTGSPTPTGSPAPKGRNIPAQGNALGHRQPTNPSPEGAEQGWRIVKLEDVAESIQYGHTASSTQEAVGPRFLRITDIQDRRVEWETVPYCSIPNNQISKYRLAKGDLLFARTGATVGKSFLITTEIPESIFASYLIRVRVNDSVDPQFIAYYFQSTQYWQQISDSSAGIGQPNVNGSKLAKITFPLPPLPEQRRIVARIEELFSRLDAGVTALRQAKAQLHRYRQSVLAAAVTGQLTQEWREQHPETEPASELLERILEQRREQRNGKGKYKEPIGVDSGEGLPTLPKSWLWTTVDSLVSSKVGNAFKSAEFSDDGVRLLRGENIEPGALRWTKTRCWPNNRVSGFEDLLIEEGDVIVAMDRPVISTGLKVAVARATDLPCLLVQRVNRLRPIPPIISGFIYLNVSTKRFVNQLLGNQTGTQLPHITEHGVRSFAIPLPPLAEQHQIVAEVEARTTAIDHLEAEIDRQITRSNRLRQSALASAFTGEL